MIATTVVPWLRRDLRDATLHSMSPALLSTVELVDNSVENRGVAWAWNRGLDAARARGSSWLVLCSTATTFGPTGGLDLLARLDEADPSRMLSVIGGGWHLHAIPLSLFDLVGPFDEWYLAYCEDLDWLRRLKLAGFNVWEGEANHHVEVDAAWLPDAHSMRLGLVSSDLHQDGLRRFAAKWGHGYDEALYFPTPWNRPGCGWSWTWQDDEARIRGNLPPTTPPYPYVGGSAA